MGLRDGLKYLERGAKSAHLARARLMRGAASRDAVHAFAAEMRNSIAHVPLIRIGGKGDGGYLLPDDLSGIRHCFSPGVSTTADFEDQIARDYGIRSYLADASVETAPLQNPMFEFDRKFLGTHCDATFTTLSAWVLDKLEETRDDDLLLQMDIEGAEFDVLIESDSALLRRFRIMVIEFHGMERVFERYSLPLIRAMFAKLHRDFALVHLHPNNCCGIAQYRDAAIPRVFEATYLRRDRLAAMVASGPITLPHPDDHRNVPANPELIMPEMWWRT
ncbi:FkbM family methyltransferase [uncultured Roseovarius sp.]|uniref:FkbM family methyltransferase n=1 Tax=uncultured Roseovarius sp. TaxID=293344 RepID=UPI002607B531|nr:FkbM family methyltransferase [uncultured Roseovarius sp.]